MKRMLGWVIVVGMMVASPSLAQKITIDYARDFDFDSVKTFAYEPGEKQLVWRGTGTVTVKKEPEAQAKQINKILTKMGKQWDKILKNM